jgi:hypothetical protein
VSIKTENPSSTKGHSIGGLIHSWFVHSIVLLECVSVPLFSSIFLDQQYDADDKSHNKEKDYQGSRVKAYCIHMSYLSLFIHLKAVEAFSILQQLIV